MVKKKSSKKTVEKKSVTATIATTDNQAAMIVKIISVFEYVGAGLSILFGLIILFGGQFFLAMLPLADIPQIPAALLGSALIILAILMLLFGVFAIFLARGLWNHKNWARIVVLVFSTIGAIMALTSLPSGILGLIVHGAIIYFLGFDKNVVALFK